MIPHILSRCLILVFAFAIAAEAQTSKVIADSSTKTFWDFECVEARIVPMRSTVEFGDAAAAEKAGYKKAEKCSTTASRGVEYFSQSEPTSQKIVELRKKSTSLSLIQDEISKWRNKTVRVIGGFSKSDRYLGEFGRVENKYYSFEISSTTGGTGYFYMPKNATSDGYRDWAFDPDLLYADCQVRILGVAPLFPGSSLSYLGGDLLSCQFWTRSGN